MKQLTRREFHRLLGLGALSLSPVQRLLAATTGSQDASKHRFDIAFSSWCFHMALWRGEMRAGDIPGIASEMGVTALEWTAKTFRDLKGGREIMFQAPGPDFFQALRRACDNEGIASKVLDVGGPFFLASSNRPVQQKAIDYVMQYVEPAQILGAGILRSELYFDGKHTPGWESEAGKYARDAIFELLERTKDSGLVINIENHHGISSQPGWLDKLMKSIDDPRFGLTLDTNNFRVDIDNPYAADPEAIPRYVNRYEAIKKLMPHTNWVSAKFYAFDSTGYEISMDYPRILDIILGAGYSGYISVEYEGHGDPLDGVRKSVQMLQRFQ